MASLGLGTLTLDLVTRIAGFTGPLDKAGRELDKKMSAMEKRATAFGKALGTALVTAASAVVTGLTAITKTAIDNADQLRDLSIRLGASTETLSAFGYAASQTGTDLDTLGRGMKILAKNAADALNPTSEQARIFEALGISVQDAEGKLKSLDRLVPEIADKFQGMADGTTKAALAQALFGKAGLDLTEFLNSGSRGLDEFTAKAERLGIIVGTDTANAADEFNDKVGDLKATVAGFGNQLAADLLPELIKLVDYFQETTKQGELLGVEVSDITSLFSLFAGEIKKADEVGDSFRAMLTATNNAAASLKGGLSSLLSLEVGGFIKKMNDARNAATSALLAGFGFHADKPQAAPGRARNARGGSNREETGGVAVNLSALSNALGGVKEPKATKAKGGKSDAQKEAEQLEEAYKRMVAQQKETIALFGLEGEAAKVAYDIKNGEIAKWLPARQQEVLANAELIDQQKLMAELQDAADDAVRKSTEAYESNQAAVKDQIADMEFELHLLGLSNIEREKEIALRYAGADATEEQRQRIAELVEETDRAAKANDFWRDTQDSISDALFDIGTRAKTAEEAVGDFLDAIYSSAVKAASDYFSEAITNMFKSQSGSGASGSAGGSGGWGAFFSFIGGLFGGGKANGGNVVPGKFYEVGEQNRPEMFFAGGKQYMIPGNAGRVEPMSRNSGTNLTQKFYTMGTETRRTQQRKAQLSGREAQRALARNGV